MFVPSWPLLCNKTVNLELFLKHYRNMSTKVNWTSALPFNCCIEKDFINLVKSSHHVNAEPNDCGPLKGFPDLENVNVSQDRTATEGLFWPKKKSRFNLEDCFLETEEAPYRREEGTILGFIFCFEFKPSDRAGAIYQSYRWYKSLSGVIRPSLVVQLYFLQRLKHTRCKCF